MFKIIVDSAANIPADLAKKYDIQVISFVNWLNGQQLTCYDPSLNQEQEREKGKLYYDAIRQGAEVKTGLIASGTFCEVFLKALEEDQDVLYFCLSKNISGNYNSARLGAEMALESADSKRQIRIIDSLNASLGQGILAIYASEMRAQGKSFEETANTLESYPAKMMGLFTVGDLKYLAKTGRVSNVKAFVGNALSIKPILKGNKDGYIVQFKNVRGRKASLNTLVDLLIKNITNPEEQIIGIAHADAYEESLEVMAKIQEKIKVRGFINTSYDFCTGSHVGPDTIALFFMADDRELNK